MEPDRLNYDNSVLQFLGQLSGSRQEIPFCQAQLQLHLQLRHKKIAFGSAGDLSDF